MAVIQVLAWIVLLLTVTAYPEIPTKGKHTRVQDAGQQTSVEDVDMPRFAEPIANVTVSIGRDALLACVVENLKGYKVAWVRVDTQTILSIHHNVISQNNRISLTYNDHRSWYLHIKEVEESDRGWYMCQVNTDPMRSRKGFLQVVVPPMIVEGMTSNDMVVREGLNVTLMCKARGYPEPYVMWRREDGEEMLIGGEHVNVVDGELLHITKVSRLHMAAYLCVASNGVPPSISKRVHLRVQFPPMLSIPNQLEGAYVGQDVVLECHTEAYPASINYWTTERGDMIISDTSRAGDKFETTSAISGYTKYMKLRIRAVGPNDFGTYRCVAKNSLGETDGNIKLDEMPTPTTAIISEMAMLNRSLVDGKRRNRKFDLNALPDYGVEEWRDGTGNGLGSHSGGGDGDGNQTPVRNPPGAFHNAAGTLAQHNLLGRIIHGIRAQSLGMLQRLAALMAQRWPSACQAVNTVEMAIKWRKAECYQQGGGCCLSSADAATIVDSNARIAANGTLGTAAKQKYNNNNSNHNRYTTTASTLQIISCRSVCFVDNISKNNNTTTTNNTETVRSNYKKLACLLPSQSLLPPLLLHPLLLHTLIFLLLLICIVILYVAATSSSFMPRQQQRNAISGDITKSNSGSSNNYKDNNTYWWCCDGCNIFVKHVFSISINRLLLTAVAIIQTMPTSTAKSKPIAATPQRAAVTTTMFDFCQRSALLR